MALKVFSPVRATRSFVDPLCTNAALPTEASGDAALIGTVTTPPDTLALMTAKVCVLPPPPGPGAVGRPLLPHPSIKDVTVTSEIA